MYCTFFSKNPDLYMEEEEEEGQSKITEPYLITFESSKMDLKTHGIKMIFHCSYIPSI